MSTTIIENPNGGYCIGSAAASSGFSEVIKRQFKLWADECLTKQMSEEEAIAYFEGLNPAFKSDRIFQECFPTCFKIQQIERKVATQ